LCGQARGIRSTSIIHGRCGTLLRPIIFRFDKSTVSEAELQELVVNNMHREFTWLHVKLARAMF
jgi:hypothetical protein